MGKVSTLFGAAICGLGALVWSPAYAQDHDGAIVLTPTSSVNLLDYWYYIPPDTYTRLVICEKFVLHDDCHTPKDSQYDKDVFNTSNVYPYKTRSWFAKLFIGRSYSDNLSVNIKSGNFQTAAVLASISHSSSRQAKESFARTVSYRAMNYPLFLVRGTGAGEVASADVKMAATDSVTSYAASDALAAVVAATRALTAPPPLLTKLSVNSSNAAATAIDNTISMLFGEAITEDQTEDQKISRWRDVEITFRIPKKEGGWNDLLAGANSAESKTTVNNLNYGKVGVWLIYFDYPHVSAFSTEIIRCKLNQDGLLVDGQACGKALDDARSRVRSELPSHYNDVLNFPIILNSNSPIKISDILKQEDWWTAAIKSISPATGAADPEKVDVFCRQIRGTVGDQGFNSLDQYFVVAAVAQSSLVTKDQGAAMADATHSPSCVDPATPAAVPQEVATSGEIRPETSSVGENQTRKTARQAAPAP